MSWSDRRRFLKAVGPFRLAAMGGGIAGAWMLYLLLRLWFGPRLESSNDWSGIMFAVSSLLQLTQAGVGLYLCGLSWYLADAIAMSAGGRQADMQRWSELQLRIVRVIVLLLIVTLASNCWDWYCRGLTIQRLLDLHDLR